jgi:hypothetical protein
MAVGDLKISSLSCVPMKNQVFCESLDVKSDVNLNKTALEYWIVTGPEEIPPVGVICSL